MLNFDLFTKGTTIGVGLSGGKDSMCLLNLIIEYKTQLGINVVAINVEHGIRGQDSIDDSEFVKNYCNEKNVTCYAYCVDALNYAKENGLSVEQSARILRYNCFFDAISSGKCDVIATAHHKSDNVETVLFNLFRGTSLTGASGIKPVDYNQKVIRPLLFTDKKNIDDYVLSHDIPFVEDKTNGDETYTRNYLRLNVIPLIKNVFPSFENSIERFADSVRLDDEYLNGLAANGIRYFDNCVEIDFEESQSVFYRRVIAALKYLGVKKDYEKVHAQAVYKLQYCENSSCINLPQNVIAVKDYEKITLYIAENTKKPHYSQVFGEGTYDFDGGTLIIKKVCKPSADELKKGFYCDADKLSSDTVIRYRKNGDVFTKFGGGTKKLNDFFTDKKIPERSRNDVLIVASGNTVYFINNIAVSDLIKVDNTTKNVLQFVYITK